MNSIRQQALMEVLMLAPQEKYSWAVQYTELNLFTDGYVRMDKCRGWASIYVTEKGFELIKEN